MKNKSSAYSSYFTIPLRCLGIAFFLLFSFYSLAQTPANDSLKLSNKKIESVILADSGSVPPIVLKNRGKFIPSPRKAGLLSAVFPGAGQIYNRKWWKVPIVYAGYGTLGYFLVDNNRNFIKFRDAYINRIKGDRTDLSLINEFPVEQQLSRNRDFWRRNRDFTVILMALFYAITIVDATVDAHFYTFNITDDLDVTLAPQIQSGSFNDALGSSFLPNRVGSFQAGLQLNFTFK